MSLLRPLCFALLAITASLAGAERAPQSAVTVLIDVLKVRDVTNVMREEGLIYAVDLNQDMLDGQAGSLWETQINAIYNPERMTETVANDLAQNMSAEHIDQSIAFFGSDVGQDIISLEVAARAAMADKDVEEFARDYYTTLKSEDPQNTRLAMIEDFVSVNDLWERNVSGALTANFQFYAGLVDGGGLEMTEDEMFADFAGFNTMYENISYSLGQAISVHMVSEQL